MIGNRIHFCGDFIVTNKGEQRIDRSSPAVYKALLKRKIIIQNFSEYRLRLPEYRRLTDAA